eukprot:gene13231-17731_t
MQIFTIDLRFALVNCLLSSFIYSFLKFNGFQSLGNYHKINSLLYRSVDLSTLLRYRAALNNLKSLHSDQGIEEGNNLQLSKRAIYSKSNLSNSSGVGKYNNNSNNKQRQDHSNNRNPDVETINQRILSLRKHLDCGSGNKFCQELKLIAHRSDIPSSTDHSVIYPFIYEFVNSDITMTGQHAAECIFSMPKLGFSLQFPKYRDLTFSLIEKLKIAEFVTSRDVTTSFGGLAKLRMQWKYLPPATQSDLLDLVSSVVGLFNDREISNILHSMSKLSITWNDIPQKLQNELLAIFMARADKLVSQQGTMSVYAFGILGVSLPKLPQNVQTAIYDVSSSVLGQSAESSQQVANIIYGLAKLDARYSQLPDSVKESMFIGIRKMMHLMNEQEVANTVYALGIIGAKWTDLPDDIGIIISTESAKKFKTMTNQGLSSSVYGMGLLGYQWSWMNNILKKSLFEAIRTYFNVETLSKTNRGQTLANIIYSLGTIDAEWNDFPKDVQDAFELGILYCSTFLSSQEMSNLIYGLGLLKVDYNKILPTTKESLESIFKRYSMNMNEQEICSTLNGFAKMNATYNEISPDLVKTILICVTNQQEIARLCLACTVYSLGVLGFNWNDLPYHVRNMISKSCCSQPLREQIIANIIYGLCQLEAKWFDFDHEMRTALIENIENKESFLLGIPQHTANVILGLGKMDAYWYDMIPAMKNLEEAFVRCHKKMNEQEISNVIYGFTIMDVSWNDLNVQTQIALKNTLQDKAKTMSMQEIANTMFSMAILSYDSPYHIPYYHGNNELIPSNNLASESQETIESMQTLWSIHETLLTVFKDL